MIFTFMQNKNLSLLTWIHNDNESSSKILFISIPLPFLFFFWLSIHDGEILIERDFYGKGEDPFEMD